VKSSGLTGTDAFIQFSAQPPSAPADGCLPVPALDAIAGGFGALIGQLGDVTPDAVPMTVPTPAAATLESAPASVPLGLAPLRKAPKPTPVPAPPPVVGVPTTPTGLVGLGAEILQSTVQDPSSGIGPEDERATPTGTGQVQTPPGWQVSSPPSPVPPTPPTPPSACVEPGAPAGLRPAGFASASESEGSEARPGPGRRPAASG
jgi:hypothetical protein